MDNMEQLKELMDQSRISDQELADSVSEISLDDEQKNCLKHERVREELEQELKLNRELDLELVQMANQVQAQLSWENDMDQSLLSFERLDRASPDLWPEQMPGVSEFAALSPPGNNHKKWVNELDKGDMEMIQDLGNMTVEQVMEKVRSLQSMAYTLGLDEAREMTRGKFLNILEKPEKRT